MKNKSLLMILGAAAFLVLTFVIMPHPESKGGCQVNMTSPFGNGGTPMWVDLEKLSQCETAAGFEFTAPEEPLWEEYPDVSCRVYTNQTIEVIYSNGETVGYTLSKANTCNGSSFYDIKHDFKSMNTKQIDGIDVKIYADEENTSSYALWSRDGVHALSVISVDHPVSLELLEQFVNIME